MVSLLLDFTVPSLSPIFLKSFLQIFLIKNRLTYDLHSIAIFRRMNLIYDKMVVQKRMEGSKNGKSFSRYERSGRILLSRKYNRGSCDSRIYRYNPEHALPWQAIFRRRVYCIRAAADRPWN